MSQTITPETVEQAVYAALKTFGVEPHQMTREATFESLEVDSLDLVELAQIVQEEFGVKLDAAHMAGLNTVGDAIDMVVGRA